MNGCIHSKTPTNQQPGPVVKPRPFGKAWEDAPAPIGHKYEWGVVTERSSDYNPGLTLNSVEKQGLKSAKEI